MRRSQHRFTVPADGLTDAQREHLRIQKVLRYADEELAAALTAPTARELREDRVRFLVAKYGTVGVRGLLKALVDGHMTLHEIALALRVSQRAVRKYRDWLGVSTEGWTPHPDLLRVMNEVRE